METKTESAAAPTKRRRGKNKLPTKGTRSEDGIYKLSREQKDAKNARKREQTLKEKLAKIMEENNKLRSQLSKALVDKDETVLFASLNVLGQAAEVVGQRVAKKACVAGKKAEDSTAVLKASAAKKATTATKAAVSTKIPS